MTNSFKESAYVSAPTLRRDTPELFSVASEGEKVGSIGVSINPYHNRNHYLRLDLSRYETEWAKPLFERLAYELKHPLQVMASSGELLETDTYVLHDYAAGKLSETDTYVPDEYAAGKLSETDAYVPAGRMSCGFSWNADKPCLLRTGTSADMAKRS